MTREVSRAGLAVRGLRWVAVRLPRGKARLARVLSHVLRRRFVDTVEPRDLRLRMVIDPDDPFQLEMWLGAYQPHVVSFLRRNIKANAVVLAAGLQVGYVAAIAAKLAGPGGRVFSAEPDPAAREVAQENLKLLDATCASVDVLTGGLSDSDDDLTMYLSWTLGHSSFAAPHQPRSCEVVPVRCGDEWLEERGVKALDVLVLDLEGWECHALRGLTAVVAASPNLVALVEVCDWALRDAGSSVPMLLDWMRDNGFDLFWAETASGEHGVSGAPARADDVRAGDVLGVRKASIQ